MLGMHARVPKNFVLEERLERYADAIEIAPAALAGRWREACAPIGSAPFARLAVDLGCGKGPFLVATARRDPQTLFIGIDGEPVCIAYAAQRVIEGGLDNALLVPVYLQDDSRNRFVHAFHPVGVVLLILAYGEILHGYANPVRPRQPGIGGEAVKPEQRLIQIPLLVGIQFMFGNIDYFLLMDAFIEAYQSSKWREEFCSVLLAHLGVLPAEHVSVMNRTVAENDVSIASNRWWY
jgi:SAM-dependent methyltransferase